MRKFFTREFFIGFLIATVCWLWILGSIEIPEYIITRQSICA